MTANNPLSRRSLLAISAAALAGTAAPVAALASVNPDAELLRLEREHDALYTRLDAYNRTIEEVDEDDFEEAHDACCDLEFAMQDIPAQTWAGVIAKARIAIEDADPTRGASQMI